MHMIRENNNNNNNNKMMTYLPQLTANEVLYQYANLLRPVNNGEALPPI